MPYKRVCANTTTLSRRTALAALAASPLAATKSHAATPEYALGFREGQRQMLDFLSTETEAMISARPNAQEDPLPELCNQWSSAETDFSRAHAQESAGNVDTPEEIEAFIHMWDLAAEISSRVPQTVEGAQAQLSHFLDHYGCHVFGDTKDDLDKRLIENVIAGLTAMSAQTTQLT